MENRKNEKLHFFGRSQKVIHIPHTARPQASAPVLPQGAWRKNREKTGLLGLFHSFHRLYYGYGYFYSAIQLLYARAREVDGRNSHRVRPKFTKGLGMTEKREYEDPI